MNNLYAQATMQKLPVNDSEWVEDIPKLNEDFI